MARVRQGLAAVALAIAIVAPARADDSDLERRIEALEKEIRLLKDEFRASRQKTDAAIPSGPRMTMKGPAPTFESEDGRYSLSITGRVNLDVALYDQQAASGPTDTRLVPDLNSGSNLRRARLGVRGRIDGDWRYRLEIDGGGTPPGGFGLPFAYLSYVGWEPLNLTLGKAFAPNGFERNVAALDTAFIERSIATDLAVANGAGARSGLRAVLRGERWYAGAGLYGAGDGVEADDEQISVNGRLVVLPIKTDRALLHLGASGWYIPEPDQDGDERLRWRVAPEIRVDSNALIDAQSNALLANDNAFMWGLELAGRYGPFWAQGEYFRFGMDQTPDPAEALALAPDLAYGAYYVSAGYVLTGEARPYDIGRARWLRVRPADPFSLSKGHWGAWEIAARYSYADLDDEANTFSNGVLVGTRGGRERNWAAAVNWYVNHSVRFMFNYINVDVDRLNAAGLQIGDSFDVYALRMQVVW